MVRQTPDTAPAEDQGSLFEEVTETPGVTDPGLTTPATSYVPAPEGSYQDSAKKPDAAAAFEDPALLARVRAQVETQRHRTAQSGRHSPLFRDGHYRNIQFGDVLHDDSRHMIVRESNFDQAEQFAAELEERRQKST